MKKLLFFLLLSLISFTAFSQSGSLVGSAIRSRVADSTTVVYPTGYGVLYYNVQSNKWRICDSGGTCRDVGSGGGGGSSGLVVGTTTITSGTTTRVLYNNAGVLGEYVISGTGNVAMTTSPTFTTPALGTPSAVVLTNGTGLPGTSVINTPAGGIAATTAQAAINELDTEKQALLVSGTNIKTVNGTSLLGSGNLSTLQNVTTRNRLLPNEQTASFTLSLADTSSLIILNNVADLVITLDDFSAFNFGTQWAFYRKSATDTVYFDAGGETLEALSFGITEGSYAYLYYNPDDNEFYLASGGSGGGGGGGGGSGSVTSVAQSFTGGLISVAGSPITTSGTLALTVAGTSGGGVYFNSSTSWASTGVLAANALVIGGGAGAAFSTTTTASGILTFLGTPSSANLISAVTDETGTGALVFANSPAFTTPNIGSATGSISGNAGTATALATGRTISISGDLTYTSPSFDGTGNVTAAGTIANNAVTFAKMQAITDNRLLGSQGGTAVEEISLTANDFDLSSNTIALDYTNGQKATSSLPGFISSADWLAHSRKANQRFNVTNAQTGTSYTALAADSITSTLITMNNASPNNFILPTNTTLPYRVGTILYVEQIGDGVTSIIGADGTVTLTYEAGVSAAVCKNGPNAAIKTGTNTWKIWNGSPPLAPAELSKTNGTYITITLTGTPTTALLQAVTITADLTTAVPVSLGGTGLTTIAAGDYLWGSATNTISAKNAFATTQTALLHLKAGTATASTAPFKLTTGTVNTTAEAGAFEYTTPQLFFTNGGARRQEIPLIQQSRVSTQFDATSNTTLANITGLTATLVAAKIYRFEAVLYTTSNVAGGVKFAIAGTATATNIIYECVVIDSNVNAAQTRATALATAVGGITTVTVAYVKITGTITVNAAGTLTVQFAQNASNGTASSVLVGSTFVLTEML